MAPGEPNELRCNGCSAELEPKTSCVASTCSHLFCTRCATCIIEADEPCPICQSGVSKANIRLVTALQSSSACKLMLCGQDPKTIMDTALFAMSFWGEQQALSARYKTIKLTQKLTKLDSQCRAKLEHVHRGFQNARAKYEEALQAKNAVEQDLAEVQQKYTQKSMQARKLQEMFRAVQAENEELRRRCGVRGSSGGNLLGGGGGSGRQPSPFGNAPGQMVTTVHQSKSIIELSPSAGGLPGFLTGHGSATVGGAHHRPGTAGMGAMFAGSSPGALGGGGQRRPGTAGGTGGGMFSAGALANPGGNRLGGAGTFGSAGLGGGGGGGASMRMPSLHRGGLAGLGSPGQGMMSM